MGRLDAHVERTRRLAEAIERAAGRPGPAFDCPYLEGRRARHLALRLEPLVPGLYHALMDLNFRRLGEVFYRPQCDACDECRMIRIPVADFSPNRAQRRCLRKNRDLAIRLGLPRPSEAKQALYRRYLDARHDGQMDGSPAELHGFLYSSPLRTLEVTYELEGRLVGIGIADVEPLALSAVYCFFEPQLEQRSLGVLNVLRLVEECRRRGLPHLYLGYYVAGCRRMSYKAGYRPCEILEAGRGWVRHSRER
jgi:arginine-tRNA-protein transferase